MKKIYQVLIVLGLSLLSFFYTEKVICFIRNNDPIMKKIKKANNKYEISAINAKINKKKMIPGISGSKIDYNKSYKKMKKYGTYNESLTVFEEVKPTISIDDYYDKYISEGSGLNNDISLVFVVQNGENIDDILNVLMEKKVVATFFVDGLWLENNEKLVISMAYEGYEIEILNYDNKYEELYFSSSLNLIKTITNFSPKYCYAKYDKKEVLELCNKLKLHTIIPTILTGNYPYSDVKNKIKKGSIISFDNNASTKIELPIIIDYIKQKGFIINTLDNLLSELIESK